MLVRLDLEYEWLALLVKYLAVSELLKESTLLVAADEANCTELWIALGARGRHVYTNVL